MKRITLLVWSASLVFALAIAIHPTAASAQQCVRIAGVESSGEKLTLDPAFLATDDDALTMYAVYNRLVTLDSNMEVKPELAKSWSVSNDGLVWTFNLVHGVKFQDGRDFGAKDVVYTFRRLIDPKVASRARGLLSFLTPENIQAVDQYTVQFKTTEPIAVLPVLIANKYTLIVPDGSTGDDLRLKGVGTGPFMVEQFAPGGAKRVLRKNPHYWRMGLPKADCLEMTALTDQFTRNAAIKSGQEDLLVNLGPDAIQDMKSNASVQILPSAAGSFYTFSMLVDNPPFDDVRVRKALKLVVDRKKLVDLVAFGYGVPGNDNPVPPSWPAAYTHDAPKQNIDEAKRLLAAAGHPNGLTLDLYTSDIGTGVVQMSEAYQQMAAQAGIQINLIKTPADSYWDTVYMKHPFFVSSWTIRPPAEGLSYTYTYPKDSGLNETDWFRDDYNAIIKQARSELDPTKRTALFKQAQKMLADEGGVIVPLHLQNISAIRKECSGFKTHLQTYNLNFETVSCKR